MKQFLYIDESGDLGFNFEQKNPSPFFTIALLVIRGEEGNKQMKKEIEIVLKRKLNPKNKKKRIIDELKGTNTTLAIKKYFYKRVEKINFDVYSITLNKKNVNIDLQANTHRLYNEIVKKLIEKVCFDKKTTQVLLYLDKMKNKKEIQDCNNYISTHLESILPLETRISIVHEDSKKVKPLQGVDLFCYGVAQKYNRKNCEWISCFTQKIKYEKLFSGNKKRPAVHT